ncbi:hypothetical protein [Melittangium boletus]|uniref:hypothetical protein n=1 Tax=Melittangium boletus TaxID=83453 RepID=UPI003DA414BE
MAKPVPGAVVGTLTACLGLLLGCASAHDRTLSRVYRVNERSEQLALSRFLRGERATLLTPALHYIDGPARLGGMDARLRPEDSIRVDGVDLRMNWEAFDRAMRKHGRVEAQGRNGEWILVTEALPWMRDSNAYYIQTRDGRIWVLTTQLVPVRTLPVSIPHCDNTPVFESPSWVVFVFPGLRAADLKPWPRPLVYEGEDVRSRCLSTTE